MVCERPNTLNFARNLGMRIGFRLDDVLGHGDRVQEFGLRLFPNSPHMPRACPLILDRSLVWPFTSLSRLRLLNKGA